MEELKLFCWDRGHRGIAVVVTTSFEKAREYFKSYCDRFDPEWTKDIYVVDIKEGTFFENTGDA